MSQRNDFSTLYKKNFPDNVQKLISPVIHREVMKFLEDYAVFRDELVGTGGGGFSGDWVFISSGGGNPATGQFITDSSSIADIEVLKLSRNAIDLAFNGSINKLSNVLIKDSTGKGVVFEITSMSQSSSYVTLEGGYAASGTLSTLVLNDTYTLSLMYGDVSATVSNYFCTSWEEVKSAVVLSNAGNGGNIFTSGDIRLTESVVWDLTGITFYGGDNTRWRVLDEDSVKEGSRSYTVTASAGSIKFHNFQFRGSGGGSAAQTFSIYSTRPIFKVISGDADVILDGCVFVDIIGGVGTNQVIEYTNITGGTASEIKMNGCRVSSHNNGVPFSMLGFSIKTLSHSGDLIISVLNQGTPTTSSGISGTDMMYSGNLGTPANTIFYTDGTATGGGDIDASNSSTPISNSRRATPVLLDKIWMAQKSTGRMVATSIGELKTLILS
jgi:hypothetical protein